MDSLKTILYFSIFNYPLRSDEIHRYNNYLTEEETKSELQKLIEHEIVSQQGEFFLYNCDVSCIERRLKGNVGAERALETARKKARLISRFPYVEAVGVSGSLSKGYFDEASDIDFFIITREEKLWICRTLLILYKKVFLFNSRKHFCVNYFISRSRAEIEEQNRFTATEIKTLIPLQGREAFALFYEQNAWVKEYFSKFSIEKGEIPAITKPIMTRIIESILNNRLGKRLDDWFKILTLRRWKSKFDYMNDEDFKVALKSTRNISKHHPSNFQKKVLDSLEQKIIEAEEKFQLKINRGHG